MRRKPAIPAATLRLQKALARKAIAAKRARARFSSALRLAEPDAEAIAEANRLVAQTRAAKAALFVDRYRRNAE